MREHSDDQRREVKGDDVNTDIVEGEDNLLKMNRHVNRKLILKG